MTPKTAGQPIEVLLVEDDPGDVLLIREAFDFNKVHNNLNVVSDGEQALDYLRGTGDYTGRIRPDLVLLDLNLPRKDGREVLAEVKSDPELRTIPIVVLTTSEAEEEMDLATWLREASSSRQNETDMGILAGGEPIEGAPEAEFEPTGEVHVGGSDAEPGEFAAGE